MEEPPSIRSWNCVIVDSDSPLGKVASSVCDLTAHLPDPDVTFLCSVCFGKQWPCERFDIAAGEILTARLSLAALVPSELHQRLWPQSPQWPGPSQS